MRLRHASPALVLLALGGALAACGGPDEMKLGEEADIGFYSDGGTTAAGEGTIAVTDVREGSAEEMKAGGFDLDPDEESASIYYVDVTFENQGDSEVTLRSPSGEDGDDNLISSLAVIDLGGPPYDKCPGVPEKLAAGESVDGCSILLVPAGSELARISYFPGGTEDFLYWETGL